MLSTFLLVVSVSLAGDPPASAAVAESAHDELMTELEEISSAYKSVDPDLLKKALAAQAAREELPPAVAEAVVPELPELSDSATVPSPTPASTE